MHNAANRLSVAKYGIPVTCRHPWILSSMGAFSCLSEKNLILGNNGVYWKCAETCVKADLHWLISAGILLEHICMTSA